MAECHLPNLSAAGLGEENRDDEPLPMIVEPHYESLELSRPQRIGFFSSKCDSDGKPTIYLPDRSSLSFLDPDYKRVVGANLLDGYSRDKAWGRMWSNPIHILRWLTDNKDKLKEADQNVDFICHARPLKSILTTRFADPERWTIYAVKVRGSIILSELEIKDAIRYQLQQHPERAKGSYAGHKFFEEVSRRADGSKPIIHLGGHRDCFHLVNRWHMKGHSLLYSNRIDCAADQAQLSESLDVMEMVHIRTSGIRMRYKKLRDMDRKIGWWATSLVSGVAAIICGEKDKNHRVKQIITLNGLRVEVPNLILQDRLRFMDEILTAIKENVNQELIVYRIALRDGGQVFTKIMDEPAEKYIPSWYINEQPFEEASSIGPKDDSESPGLSTA